MEGPVMAGMFNDGGEHPSFSWDNDKAFKFLGDQDKREDYLKGIVGEEGPSPDIINQLRDLDEVELRQAVRQIPNDEDRRDMLKTYYNV